MLFRTSGRTSCDNDRIQAVTKALGVMLGLVFIAAGVGKAFDLERFSETIIDITRISRSSAKNLALVLALSEMISGIGLLMKRTARWAAFSLLCLTSLFLWVLLSAILKGRPIECNCFGVLNIGFPNHVELTIDLFMFNALGIVALCSGVRQKRPTEVTWKARIRWWYVVIGVVIFYIEGEMILLAFSGIDRQVENKTLTPIVLYARQHDVRIDEIGGENFLLFLLDFADFTCPPCFNDFMALCDSIATSPEGPLKHPVIGLMRPGLAFDIHDQERVDEWARASNLRFRIFLTPDSLFVQSGFRKSCAILVRPGGFVSEWTEFPLGVAIRHKILDALR